MLRALRKSYGTKLAVDGLDLEVPEGSFFGLVGPNGAGKTTTLRMVAGLLRPDAGSVVVDGVDVWADPPPRSGGWGCCPRTSACSSG